MSKILLLEDDKSLGATLQERLIRENHHVFWAKTLKEASEIRDSENLDLAILDVGLPDGSGFDLANSLREKTAVPFIFMTAASDAENRLLGFEAGAEEFIPKPFHLKELLIRVRHVLESHVPRKLVEVADVIIDFDQMLVSSSKGTGSKLEKKLQTKEFLLLKLLIDLSPKVVSRENILDRIWGEEQFPSERTVDNVILRIRQTLGGQAGLWVRTVRGIGYQWIDPSGGDHGK